MTGSPVRGFLKQPAQARRALFMAALLLPIVRLALVTVGYQRTQKALAALFRHRPPRATFTLADGRELRQWVDRAARHGGSGATCLPQALVTWALLRQRGVTADVRLGARRVDARLQAHAWVEVAGQTLDPDPPADATPYVVFHSSAPGQG